MAKIAFFGLGNMGGPMATNLLKAGHEVCVFDLVPDVIQTLIDAGATTADTAEEVAKNAEFVISMLPAGKHVESLYLGGTRPSESGLLDTGLLNVLSKNAVILDSSTIDAATARKVGAVANEIGITMLDTPVSGGVTAAIAGTLAFMCGGSAEGFAKAKPVLLDMGANIFHAGDHGSGQVAKICNNMLLSVLMVGTSEALCLGVNNGLDPSVLAEIMLSSSGRNWTLEVYNPYPGVMENVPASKDYQPGFMVDLMCKDLGLAMDTAIQSGSSTPMGTLANDLYKAHAEQGNGKLDFSSILKTISKKV